MPQGKKNPGGGVSVPYNNPRKMGVDYNSLKKDTTTKVTYTPKSPSYERVFSPAEIERLKKSGPTLPAAGGGRVDASRVPKPKLSAEDSAFVNRMKGKKK